MKKIVIPVLALMSIAGTAQAQTDRQPLPDSVAMEEKTTDKEKGQKIKSKRIQKSQTDTVTNPRVIYKSKRTKQKATHTGQQATGVNSSHSANPKNKATGR